MLGRCLEYWEVKQDNITNYSCGNNEENRYTNDILLPHVFALK